MSDAIVLQTEEHEDQDKVKLFEIDGQDYFIDNRPRINVGLRYMRDLRDKGENIATANLLTAVLGAEGFDALCDYDDLKKSDLQAIVNVAQKTVLGELSDAGKD